MVTDPILKPRITVIPEVSEKALRLFRDSLVWDDLMPWLPGVNLDGIDVILPRFREVGVNFISLTLAAGAGLGSSISSTMEKIAKVRNEIRDRTDWLVLATSVEEIRKAKVANKLAVNFNFQETLPFETNLEMIQTYYDLGVRQALLAYNQRNLVGDGCAERADAGLSNYGVQVVGEMNRVGMLVDGSHSGYRTTMEAMEVCDAPFIFSHSNPYSVRPHYRSIKDDQIRACAATGGIVGINGVGFWVGDVDAGTDAIFRCLDYTVELVGPEHVGLGFDYVHNLDGIIEAVRNAPLAWPPYKGEEMVKHNYAGPEQMVQLVQVMLDHGYPDAAIVGILGENWATLCQGIWK
jgi:membrane dipeptidase